jgi:tetratricopeptide (TPR) repeat protein
MGVCYYELRNFDEAIKSMKEALKYNPQHQIAHLNLGIVNMTAGNHDEAIKWLNKAVDIDPNTPIAKRAQELINSH